MYMKLYTLFLDYTIHVADFLPQDGWTEHPERVDQTLSILSRIPFTVSFKIIIAEGHFSSVRSEISELKNKAACVAHTIRN